MRCDDNGKVRSYTVSPYKLLSLNGRYYMLCSDDTHDGIAAYRLDRITDICLLDTKQRPIITIDGYKNGLDLAAFVNEHPNMWGDEVSRCTFICHEYLMNDITDWFGTDTTRIRRKPKGMIEAVVLVSEDAMVRWAVQYAESVEVISPVRVRERIRKILTEAAHKYNG